MYFRIADGTVYWQESGIWMCAPAFVDGTPDLEQECAVEDLDLDFPDILDRMTGLQHLKRFDPDAVAPPERKMFYPGMAYRTSLVARRGSHYLEGPEEFWRVVERYRADGGGEPQKLFGGQELTIQGKTGPLWRIDFPIGGGWDYHLFLVTGG